MAPLGHRALASTSSGRPGQSGEPPLQTRSNVAGVTIVAMALTPNIPTPSTPTQGNLTQKIKNNCAADKKSLQEDHQQSARVHLSTLRLENSLSKSNRFRLVWAFEWCESVRHRPVPDEMPPNSANALPTAFREEGGYVFGEVGGEEGARAWRSALSRLLPTMSRVVPLTGWLNSTLPVLRSLAVTWARSRML